MTLASRLEASPAVQAITAALAGADGIWLVGGAVREAARGGEVTDVDLAVAKDEAAVSARIAETASGPAFPLSEQFGTWRVLSGDRSWGVDVTRLRGDRIEDDLAMRDFTVNALALPIDGLDRPPIDPCGGLPDLEAGVLRAVSERSFADDPLRVLRGARIAAALGFEIDPATVSLARNEAARAGEPAGERQFAELRSMITGPAPLRGLRLLDDLGATPAILPELEALRGVEQNPYHHLDAHGHTVEVLERTLAIERDLPTYVGERAAEVEELLEEPLADELTRGGALRFGALFHDLGKPSTRNVTEEGRILFLGHDQEGARIVRGLCGRLGVSRSLTRFLEATCRHHLRVGFMVHERPLSRRRVLEYLRATAPFAVEITLLTVADRLATQGERTKPTAIDAHLELARQVLGEALDWWREGPPRSPIRGDELARELGLEPGPEIGRLLSEIEAAVFAEEIESGDEALELARRLSQPR